MKHYVKRKSKNVALGTGASTCNGIGKPVHVASHSMLYIPLDVISRPSIGKGDGCSVIRIACVAESSSEARFVGWG